MQRFILILFIVIIIGGTWYYYKPTNLSYDEIDTVFVSPQELLINDVIIKMNTDSFEPAKITVKVGQRVAFFNESSVYSWPASDPHPTHTNFPKFDPELPMKPGEVWVYKFEEVGIFEYHDHLDPSKRGIVEVSN